MTSRPYARAATFVAALLTLTLPSVAAASSGSGSGGSTGGAGLSAKPTTSTTSGTTTTTSATTTTVTATPIAGPVSAQDDGITLNSTATGTYQRTLSFTGSVPSADRADVVQIQRQNAAQNWQTVAQSAVADDGTFSASWRASVSGEISFRAVLGAPAGTAQAAALTTASDPGSPTLAVTVYRNAIATIYGPGFYGHKTACGIKLTATTVGVASRTLKCGTEVSIDYDGQSVTVPVIDRGPYANGASWDLTEATAAALEDPDTETVGAAVL